MEKLTINLDKYPGPQIPVMRPQFVAQVAQQMCNALTDGTTEVATGELVNIAAAVMWRVGFDLGHWMNDEPDKLVQAAAFIAWAFRQGAGLKD